VCQRPGSSGISGYPETSARSVIDLTGRVGEALDVHPLTKEIPLDPHGLAADQAGCLGRVVERVEQISGRTVADPAG
jgi:hypothetical protein